MRVLMSATLVAGSLLAGLLSGGPAFAQTALAPGKPAGVKQAVSTSEKRELYVIAGVTIASAGLAIVLIGNKGSSAPTSTTP